MNRSALRSRRLIAAGSGAALALTGLALAGAVSASGAPSGPGARSASAAAPLVEAAAAKKKTTKVRCKTGKNGKKTCKSRTSKTTTTKPTSTRTTSTTTTSTTTTTTSTSTTTTTTTTPSWKALNDNSFATVREAAYNSRDYVIYRPSDVTALGRPMPVLAFGNGACAHNNGSEVVDLLSAIASKGIVVVDTANINGSGASSQDGNPVPSLLTGAITWAQNENNRSGAALAGHLDLTRVATAGHSCGGLESLVAGADSRVGAVISLDSGLFADASFGYSRNELTKLHTPVLFMDGGSGDIAYDNSRANYGLVSVPAILAEHSQAGHTGFITGYQRGDAVTVVVSFMDAVLDKNSSARSFLFDSSGLASKSGWSVQRKNW